MVHSSPSEQDPLFDFLPYLVPVELSWHQMHVGSGSNCNANEILMTLKLAKGQIPVIGISLAG